MIYIVEGSSSSGKTTFVKSLVEKGVPLIEKKPYSFEEMEKIIPTIQDGVFDKPFIHCNLRKTDEELLDFSDWLKSFSNVVCIKCTCDKTHCCDKAKTEKQRIYYEEEWEWYKHCFEVMDCFTVERKRK